MTIILVLANSNTLEAPQGASFFFFADNVFMKKLILLTALLTTTTLFAKPGNTGFGAGVIIGDPTALSGKYFMGETAFDFGLSTGHHELLIYGDYLRHFKGKFGNQNAFVSALTPYVGVGPVFAFADGDKDHNKHFIEDDDDDFTFGGRIPLGVEWIYNELPIGVSLEIAPGVKIIPETDAFVQGGLAVRYYF